METSKPKKWRFTRVDLAIEYNVPTRTIHNWIKHDEVLSSVFKREIVSLTPLMINLFYERCGHPRDYK